MKIFKLFIAVTFISVTSWADSRGNNIAPTTTIPAPPTTVDNGSGVLPVATGLASQQQSAQNKLMPFVTGIAAGGACYILATQFTGCATCSAGAAICCVAPAVACGAIAFALASNIGKAKNQTNDSIKAVDTNKPVDTDYEKNVPNPTPVPTDNPNPTDGGGGITSKIPTKPGAPPKVVLPDGRKFDLKDLGSDSAMAKSGFSPSEISDMRAMSAALSKKIAEEITKGSDKGESMFSDGLSSGGGKSRHAGEDDAEAQQASAGAAGFAVGKVDATGLARRCGDSMCGTANDGIFVMINRQMVKQCDTSKINCK